MRNIRNITGNGKYVDKFIGQFIKDIVPKGKTALVVHPQKLPEKIQKNYDYIVLVNILEKEVDIIGYLKDINEHLNPRGRLIIIYENYLYSFLVRLLGYKKEEKNWLSKDDLVNFVKLAGFEKVLAEPLCFLQINMSLISNIVNKFLLFFFPFNHLSFLHYMLATKAGAGKMPSVSIIIPARNEAGNIRNIFSSLPSVGKECEVVFVEGHSSDDTYETIENYIRKYKGKRKLRYKLIQQKGKGKADAIHLGIRNCQGEVVIIYDADMTVAASEIYRFYEALVMGRGDFINGSRLVYPVEAGAMQFLNILGNKFFSLFFTFIFGTPIKDTLCGSKAFWRDDYLLFKKQNMEDLRRNDPFGDFYLLYGAKKLNLHIVDLPVRYYSRTYGSSNIARFKNAWELLLFSFSAFKRLKMRL